MSRGATTSDTLIVAPGVLVRFQEPLQGTAAMSIQRPDDAGLRSPWPLSRYVFKNHTESHEETCYGPDQG